MATAALTDIIPGWKLSADSNAERLDVELLARTISATEPIQDNAEKTVIRSSRIASRSRRSLRICNSIQ